MISIKKRYLMIISMIWLVLPAAIYIAFWCRLFIGIPIVLMMGFGVFKVFIHSEEDTIPFDKKGLILIIILSGLYLLVSGMGGLFPQSWDNHTKNAILRDLINQEWPIRYPQNGYVLVYYVSYWLIPAAFGKIAGWYGANIVLVLWSWIGLSLVMIWVCSAVGNVVSSSKKITMIVVLFFLWGGLNCIGEVINKTFALVDANTSGSGEGWLDGGLNGYYSGYLYRGMFDSIEYVYNQAIPCWLAMCMLLNTEKTRYYGFIGCSIVAYAPIPFIGIIPFFIAKAMVILKKDMKGSVKDRFRTVISALVSYENIIGCLVVLPLFFLFYKSNLSSEFGLYVPVEAWSFRRTVALSVFFAVEFIVFLLLLLKVNRKNVLFWVAVVSLFIIPFFKTGDGRDFCMNASLPALMYICLLFLREYSEKIYGKTRELIKHVKLYGVVFIVIIVLCAVTPVSSISINIFQRVIGKHVTFYADNTYTLSDKKIGGKLKDTDTWVEYYLVSEDTDSFFIKNLMR